MDLGRPPEARLTGRVVRLSESPISREDLAHVLSQVGTVSEDNRAGIERTLHRVSAIRNRQGKVVGLTLRVGRAIYGTIDMLKDLIASGLNILLLGRPGVGKTTKLREVARVLADDLGKRVMVVDTSNEIGGDGDIPHPGIGGARRMQVSRPDRQHDVMIEAVENHMPEAIIVDEIGTSAEASAARTIAERGVQLVATAHGNTLENLVLNPTLSDLVGGVHTVTLSDEEARRRHTQKTISERRAPPTFDVVVEMVSRDEVLVHRDTAQSVDRLLAGENVGGERRQLVEGEVEVKEEPQSVAPLPVRSSEPPSLSRAAPRRAVAPSPACARAPRASMPTRPAVTCSSGCCATWARMPGWWAGWRTRTSSSRCARGPMIRSCARCRRRRARACWPSSATARRRCGGCCATPSSSPRAWTRTRCARRCWRPSTPSSAC